jgi:hypothetical protein
MFPRTQEGRDRYQMEMDAMAKESLRTWMYLIETTLVREGIQGAFTRMVKAGKVRMSHVDFVAYWRYINGRTFCLAKDGTAMDGLETKVIEEMSTRQNVRPTNVLTVMGCARHIEFQKDNRTYNTAGPTMNPMQTNEYDEDAALNLARVGRTRVYHLDVDEGIPFNQRDSDTRIDPLRHVKHVSQFAVMSGTWQRTREDHTYHSEKRNIQIMDAGSNLLAKIELKEAFHNSSIFRANAPEVFTTHGHRLLLYLLRRAGGTNSIDERYNDKLADLPVHDADESQDYDTTGMTESEQLAARKESDFRRMFTDSDALYSFRQTDAADEKERLKKDGRWSSVDQMGLGVNLYNLALAQGVLPQISKQLIAKKDTQRKLIRIFDSQRNTSNNEQSQQLHERNAAKQTSRRNGYAPIVRGSNGLQSVLPNDDEERNAPSAFATNRKDVSFVGLAGQEIKLTTTADRTYVTLAKRGEINRFRQQNNTSTGLTFHQAGSGAQSPSQKQQQQQQQQQQSRAGPLLVKEPLDSIPTVLFNFTPAAALNDVRSPKAREVLQRFVTQNTFDDTQRNKFAHLQSGFNDAVAMLGRSVFATKEAAKNAIQVEVSSRLLNNANDWKDLLTLSNGLGLSSDEKLTQILLVNIAFALIQQQLVTWLKKHSKDVPPFNQDKPLEFFNKLSPADFFTTLAGIPSNLAYGQPLNDSLKNVFGGLLEMLDGPVLGSVQRSGGAIDTFDAALLEKVFEWMKDCADGTELNDSFALQVSLASAKLDYLLASPALSGKSTVSSDVLNALRVIVGRLNNLPHGSDEEDELQKLFTSYVTPISLALSVDADEIKQVILQNASDNKDDANWSRQAPYLAHVSQLASNFTMACVNDMFEGGSAERMRIRLLIGELYRSERTSDPRFETFVQTLKSGYVPHPQQISELNMIASHVVKNSDLHPHVKNLQAAYDATSRKRSSSGSYGGSASNGAKRALVDYATDDEHAIHKLMMRTRLTRQLFDLLINDNIIFPMSFIIFRMAIEILSGCTIFYVKSDPTGFLCIHAASVMYAEDMHTQELEVQVKFDGNLLIHAPENIQFIPDTFPVKYVRGAGIAWNTIDEDAKYFNLGNNAPRKDLLSFVTDYDWKPTYGFLPVGGIMDKRVYVEDEEREWYGTAPIYRELWSIPDPNRDESPDSHLLSPSFYHKSEMKKLWLAFRCYQLVYAEGFSGHTESGTKEMIGDDAIGRISLCGDFGIIGNVDEFGGHGLTPIGRSQVR